MPDPSGLNAFIKIEHLSKNYFLLKNYVTSEGAVSHKFVYTFSSSLLLLTK